MVISWKKFRFFYFWVWVGFRFGLNWVGLRFGSGLGLVWVSYLSWWFFLKYIFLRIGRYRLNRTEVFENLAFESPYLIIINIRLGSNANQFGMVYASPEKIESLTINAKRRKGQVNIDLLVYFTICCSDRPLFWASKFRKSIRHWLTALLIGRIMKTKSDAGNTAAVSCNWRNNQQQTSNPKTLRSNGKKVIIMSQNKRWIMSYVQTQKLFFGYFLDFWLLADLRPIS